MIEEKVEERSMKGREKKIQSGEFNDDKKEEKLIKHP